MSRLENIIERNKHPGRDRDRFAVGVTSLVLLLVVGLLAFTALQSDPPAPAAPAVQPAEHRVHDVKLYRAPPPKPKPAMP